MLADALLPVGARVRFRATITEPSPRGGADLTLAKEGDGGTVVRHRRRGQAGNGPEYAYMVRWDGCALPFAATSDDVEPVAEAVPA